MYNERKLKYKNGAIKQFLIIMLFAVMSVVHTDKISAETSSANAAAEVKKSVTKYLPVGQNEENTTVGRYALNYTGNINVYSSPSSRNDDISYCSQILPGWSNSSMGTLCGDNNSTKVVKAYLIWETRKRYNQYDENTNHVCFITHDARTYWNIYPDRVFVDDRSSQYVSGWEQSRPRIYCNVADVTTIVRTYGYGNYYVANIPVCHASDLWEQDTGGGGTPTGWQLIVIEENANYPVRAVTLKAGSMFRFGDFDWERNDYGTDPASRATVTMQTELFDGLKTKEYGDVTGQVLFGCIDAARVTENPKMISMFTQQTRDSGKVVRDGGSVVEGLYSDGSQFCPQIDMCSALYNVSGLAYGATVFGVDVANVRWDTQLYIGAAVDIAFPDFSSQQTTTLSDGNVIVSGTITNTSQQQDTGIYEGNLIVTLDAGLMPDTSKISISVNGVPEDAQKSVYEEDGQWKVKFYGGGIRNFMQGNTLSYSITCSIRGLQDQFNNSDAFNGYLRSAGTNTGHWINKAWTSSSHVDCKYTVTADANGGTVYDYPGTNTWKNISTYPVRYGTNLYDNIGGLSPKRAGYRFDGWWTDRNNGVQVYDANGYRVNNTGYWKDGKWNRTEGAVIYAHWVALKSNLKVDPAGGKWHNRTDVQIFNQQYLTTKDVPDPVRTGYTFKKWEKSNPFYGTFSEADRRYTFGSHENITDVLTATWQANKYKLTFDPNGGIVGTSQVTLTFDSSDYWDVSWNNPTRTGYTFAGWWTSPDGGTEVYAENGHCTNEGTYWHENKCVYAGDYTVYAHWVANTFTIHFDPNDGKEQTPIDDMTITYDQEVVLPDATGLYIRYTLDGEDITQQVLDGTIILDDTGVVVMMLDADTGLMMTPAGGIVNEDGSITQPDGSITMPDGSVIAPGTEEGNVDAEVPVEEATEADASGETEEEGSPDQDADKANIEEDTAGDQASVEKKGVTRTATAENTEVEDVSNVVVSEENRVEEDVDAQAADVESEDPSAEPQSDKKAYASVFMGWALEDGRDSFMPQWTAGTSFAVAEITNAAGVTDSNGATITLYAVWDDCPWIVAENLYYTLDQAQSGFITDSEILSHATAYDREDGSPIAPGYNDNGTSFTIPDYQASDFTQYQSEGSCTENLTVVDSAGSTYYKQITVYVVDTRATVVRAENGRTRFINEHYYNLSEDNGGLAADSIWKTDPVYRAQLLTAFDNLKNDTPIATYVYSKEDIKDMKAYIDAHGIGNASESDALRKFYEQFCEPNKQ